MALSITHQFSRRTVFIVLSLQTCSMWHSWSIKNFLVFPCISKEWNCRSPEHSQCSKNPFANQIENVTSQGNKKEKASKQKQVLRLLKLPNWDNNSRKNKTTTKILTEGYLLNWQITEEPGVHSKYSPELKPEILFLLWCFKSQQLPWLSQSELTPNTANSARV